MFELRDWYLGERDGTVFAKGNCHGNPKFANGTHIHTSPVVGVNIDDEGVVITTEKSVYHGLFGERRMVDGNLGLLEKIGGCSLSADDIATIEKRTRSARKAILESRRERFERALGFQEDDYIGISVDSSAPYYFRQMIIVVGGVKSYMDEHKAYVHVGMFQDSVLLEGSCQGKCFDFRFFPYAGERMEFYEWTDGAGPVLFLNVGPAQMEVDTPNGMFLIPPGETCLAATDSDRFLIDKPTVPSVDKYSLFEPVIGDHGEIVAYGSPLVDGSIDNASEGD